MSLASRRRMYVPPTLCEVVSAAHPILVALFSICQLGNPLKTLRFGPQESRSPGAKGALAMRQVKTFGTILRKTHLHRASILRSSAEAFKRVRPVSTPTPVPPDSSYTMVRYSISSEKPDTTASVCLYTIYEEGEVNNIIRQLSCLSQYCRPHHRHHKNVSPRIYTRHIKGPFCSEMSLMENLPRLIIRKSTYVVSTCSFAVLNDTVRSFTS
jgi:hypothetical protein